MNKLLPLLAFSILLLVPVSQNAFGLTSIICPDDSTLGFPPLGSSVILTSPQCISLLANPPNCPTGFVESTLLTPLGDPLCLFNGGAILSDPCGDGTVSDNQNLICLPDLNEICSTGTIPAGLQCIAQSMSSMIGGTLLEINTIPLLVGSIGTNPIITGLVGITLAGIVGQTAWFVHRRRKNE